MNYQYRLNQLKTQISTFFFPRQKWLTKKIPNTWCDKTELIRICLFECLVNYVEEEMDSIDWEHCDEIKEAKANILKCYLWIKIERPALEKEQEESWPQIESEFPFRLKDGESYDEHNRLEELIERTDNEIMKQIVDLRRVLWS